MDNQEQFKPENEIIDITVEPCHHRFFRRNAVEVGCERCSNVWIDNGRFILRDKHIVGKTD